MTAGWLDFPVLCCCAIPQVGSCMYVGWKIRALAAPPSRAFIDIP